MKKTVNPRSITDAERPWIENWSAEAHRLLLFAVRERYTSRIGLNLCSYIATRSIGEDPAVGQPQKAKYRKILAELAAVGVTPPGHRSGVPVTHSKYAVDRPAVQGGPAEAASAPRRLPAPSKPAARRADDGYADIGALGGVVVATAVAIVGVRWPELGAFVQFAAPRIDEQQEDDGYVEQAGTGAVIVQLRPQVSEPLQRAA